MRIEIEKNRHSIGLLFTQAQLINKLCFFPFFEKFTRVYADGKENFSSDFELANQKGVKIGKATHDFGQGFIEFIPYEDKI